MPYNMQPTDRALLIGDIVADLLLLGPALRAPDGLRIIQELGQELHYGSALKS